MSRPILIYTVSPLLFKFSVRCSLGKMKLRRCGFCRLLIFFPFLSFFFFFFFFFFFALKLIDLWLRQSDFFSLTALTGKLKLQLV